MGPYPAEPPWELLAALLTFQIGRDSRRPPPPTLQFSNLAGLETVFSTSRTPLKDKRKKKEKTDLRGVLLCGDICPPPREDGHGREGRGRDVEGEVIPGRAVHCPLSQPGSPPL